MINNWPKFIFFFALISLAIYFLFQQKLFHRDDGLSSVTARIYRLKIFSIVHDKYKSGNGGKILELHDLHFGQNLRFELFNDERSGIYDFLERGDTLRKDSNTVFIRISRGEKMDTIWKLLY